MAELTSPLYYCFDCEAIHTVEFGEQFHDRYIAPWAAKLAEAVEAEYAIENKDLNCS